MAGEIFVNTCSSRQDELEIIKRIDGNKVKTVTSGPTGTAWSDDVFKELCIKSKPVVRKMPNRIDRASNALKFFSCYDPRTAGVRTVDNFVFYKEVIQVTDQTVTVGIKDIKEN